jgi:hypothetical protein
MSKSKKTFKNPDIRRSEIKKYQDTMMADMGITSLDELYSDEERKRWIKALMPSENVRKKLKEMGYSLYTNDNKRSLGRLGDKYLSRLDKIASLYELTKSRRGKKGGALMYEA